MKNAKKRFSLLVTLLCAFVLVFSLGIVSACGGGESASAGGAWYYGAAVPASELGQEGDYYLNTKTLASYKKSSAGWMAVSMEQGGEWYYGTEAPDDAMGNPNDFYLNTNSGDFYHKSADGGWGEPVLQLFGKNGRDGVVWFSDAIDPTEFPEGDTTLKDAEVGDFYLNHSDFSVWQLTKGGWVSLGSLKGSDGVTPELPEAEKVTVTYDVNGGDALASDSVQVPKGDSIAALPVPTRKNYTFLGWFTGSDVNDGQVTTVTPISRDMTLVAHWVFSGKYVFDSFTVDGNPVNVAEGVTLREGKTYIFEFLAHGADDSFLQIWYTKEGIDGAALWNKELKGTAYTDGFVGAMQMPEPGEMTISISSATFVKPGVYYVYMESDGQTSSSWKVEVKGEISVTPGLPGEDKIELLDGKIASPENAATIAYDEVKSYTFVLQHDALKADSSKPRLILGANGKTQSTRYTSSKFSWTEDSDVYYAPSSYGLYVDENFNQMPYAEWLEATNDYGNPNNKSRYSGLYKPEISITVYEDELNSYLGKTSSKRDVLTVEYNGQLYYYDTAQHLFLSQTYPHTVLPVSGGQDIHIKPYIYTYTYGETMVREFNGLHADFGQDKSKSYDYGMMATMKISEFEVHDGYAEITLQLGVASEGRGYCVDEINLQPTLIYELEVDGKTVRFDLIKGEEIKEESGYTKTKLNVEVKSASGAKPVQLSDGAKNLSTSYLNAEVPKDIKLEWTGSKDDFELLGVYMNETELAQNEVYKDEYVSFAYRYDGVMEEDGKQKACFDFYHFIAYQKVPSTYSQVLRIDYTYQGIKYSQYISISSGSYDAQVYRSMGYPLLEAWGRTLAQYRDALSDNAIFAQIAEIIDPLYANKENVNHEQLDNILLNDSGPLAKLISDKNSPLKTTSMEKFNAVSAEMMARLLAKYEGVSRATLAQWYNKIFYAKTNFYYGSPWQWNYTYSYFYGLFFGAASNSFNYKAWEYASNYIFGSAETYAYFIEEVFNYNAPAEVSKLLDDVWATHIAPTNDIDTAAVAAFSAAYEAYHADPSDDTLRAYITAANNYSAALNRSEKTRMGNDANELNMLNKVWSDYAQNTAPNSDPATADLYAALRQANTAANTAKTKLTAETLGDYAKALDAYAAAMEAYSIARNGYDVIGNLKSTWDDIDSKKEEGALTDVQLILYEAYQTIRTEGLAVGATPEQVQLLKDKTDLFLGKAVSNPESYDVHIDIHTWLNNRTVFSMENLRGLSPLLLAYDAFSNHYDMLSHFYGNSLTVKQFAHAYKVLYVDKAEKGSDEYMKLLEDFFAVVHKPLDLGEDVTKKGITNILALYLNLPIRAQLEKAYKDAPTDEAAKKAYLDYVDGILAVDSYSALSNRFNYIVSGYTRPEVTGVELSVLMDKFVGYIKGGEGVEGAESFVTGFLKARKDDHSAATNYEEFNSKYPQYQGWNPSTVVNLHISSWIDETLLKTLKDTEGKFAFTTDGNEILEDRSNVKQLDACLRALYEQYVATIGKEDATNVRNHKILAENLYRALIRYLSDTADNGDEWASAPGGFKY